MTTPVSGSSNQGQQTAATSTYGTWKDCVHGSKLIRPASTADIYMAVGPELGKEIESIKKQGNEKLEVLESNLKHYESQNNYEMVAATKKLMQEIVQTMGYVYGNALESNVLFANKSMDEMKSLLGKTPEDMLPKPVVSSAVAVDSSSSTGANNSAAGGANTGTEINHPDNSGSNRADMTDEVDNTPSELVGMTGGELKELMKNDPRKFAEMMNEAKDGDKFIITNILQDHVQAMNRMESMLSNMSKSDHDTSKAIISNMRV